MKKIFLLITMITLILTGCGQKEEVKDQKKVQGNDQEEVTLKVASLIPPMTEILELVKPKLAEESINLEIVVLSDNVQPNSALAANEVDANFFQHVPYMEQFNRNNDAELVPIVPIYFANYGVYAKDYNSMDELPEDSVIAIANDVSNIDRSLALLAQHNAITLQEKTGPYYTKADIVDNPKNYKFEEVDLLMLARMYDDADAVIMTPAYAAPLGLTPKSDALLTEGSENDFAISLVARKDNAESDAIQKLAEAMTSQEVRKFLEENYDETAIPAF
ncbi:MetQ/NlpA family ABC transporter substrate-binding protein [Psychrobacillus psychrodurans]|uniref:MetQ/NlpA family ABC transporter substrate-binding protein n=1 Tax=Psychrobacillus psychrodurans TaxID=126157 RepID=UPI0008E55206|nr:MetQ/NlpA family ABC transporter substrate-binding protein [Psychrobacillus psychrodurans]MCK1997862.1 MetQ/NlpA family ABC transporter substrate-binding protein [Psychrobacillus psychrodurans]MCZ8541045.1 MetQ/NlpA family ABC transporter substrate-binding protein [Psychrobacillus psychrodurans]SFM83351.1 D-methionine transport system substrate-binding protein [Psychrobacillus psychrodurans]